MEALTGFATIAAVAAVLYGLYVYRNYCVEKYNLHLFRSWAFLCQTISFVLCIIPFGEDMNMTQANMLVFFAVSGLFFVLGAVLNLKRAPPVIAVVHSALQWLFVFPIFIGGVFAWLALQRGVKAIRGH